MSGKPIDAESETVTATADDVPTADLRTGQESSEKLDAAFELLADPLRRDALARLAETGNSRLDLSTLAVAVASPDATATGPAPDGATPDAAESPDAARAPDATEQSQATDERTPRSVAVELHHVHLPKLESHGVVAYDPERRTVRYCERAWLTEWLEHVRLEESE